MKSIVAVKGYCSLCSSILSEAHEIAIYIGHNIDGVFEEDICTWLMSRDEARSRLVTSRQRTI